MNGFKFNEKYLSQLPALQQLINLGFEYITPEQAAAQRGGQLVHVLLEDTLRKQLGCINRIRYKGCEYKFSEENIRSAVRKIRNIPYQGLQKTNEAVYDLLTLGIALEQTIEGDSKSFSMNYIDWKQPDNNLFQVTAEFPVLRRHSVETARPDIVLFVNGIPLAVIECKAPDEEVEQAVSQNIRNQGADYIPQLFIYAQLLMGVNKTAALYATTGSDKEYWSAWQEREDPEDAVNTSINALLTDRQKDRLFSGEFARARGHFDSLEKEKGRLLTEQDKSIYSLCRPQRLLDLTYRFVVFDNGIKKIARYQQYFVVHSTIRRLKQRDNQGRRRGGMIWHTQGSGKSLTMVMLVRTLALDTGADSLRIVLVTDRKDLDKQLGNTFAACGLSRERATSGRNLIKHLRDRVNIITGLVHKFKTALAAEKYTDTSADVLVLVDESHRTNFGELAALMRKMLPNACYLGFTGTPLTKAQKNNFAKFGELIQPSYTIRQAVSDKAVVPLLYEGRHVEMKQDKTAVDLWFERHTAGLNANQKADLKKKYARAELLSTVDQVVYMRAFDISEHFRAHWQNTGFKAQLVAPLKSVAIRYHQFLNELGSVSSEVIISAPDTREGHEQTDKGSTDAVNKFWRTEMGKYGSEEKRDEYIIERFKDGDEPELLIVVNKLLTGFDAPRNTVLYLCCTLREHTLLQAIARVNRVCQNKKFGYIIDYNNVLEELDMALTMYDALEDFDEDDLAESLTSISEETDRLPQRHSDLWDIFKQVKNRNDEEEYEQLLADMELREEFHARLSEYAKTLAVALSSERFVTTTDESEIKRYKNDLKRFQRLSGAVRLRYAESVDFSSIEPRLRKLLDTHIQADTVTRLHEPVNIFDNSSFNQVKEEQGVYGGQTTAARADTIAHAVKRTITEKMDEDPAFFRRFSELIQEVIDASRSKRISDLEYLNQVIRLREQVVSARHDEAPAKLRNNDEACAYYGVVKPVYLAHNTFSEQQLDDMAADTALAAQIILANCRKVDFWNDLDARNSVKNAIDDYLHDEIKHKHGIPLSIEQMDDVIEKLMRVARRRSRIE
ncbi:MAG: HsdR family type I site-specific deoxyribonuclease [Gammaproteobacteria bacterium]|nr:HsdR family type I site-specific deoxyribonuclease [Gammaproteobacteria bacterium]